jgi:DsbC/DsbD-like thiol-disulfide interchange protein
VSRNDRIAAIFRPMKTRLPYFLAGHLAVAALAIIFFLPVPSAEAGVGTWAVGEAKVRLIAEGVDEQGRLNAGIEITLAPGWKTYWRSPGDAGVAPLIDFSTSRNVSDVEVAYPVPHRYDDGFSVTNVYENRVVLPISGLVDDLSRPVELTLDLTIGVCREICIPDHFETELSIPVNEHDAAASQILTEARDLLPQPAQPGVFAVEKFVRDGGTEKRPVFLFDAMIPATDDAEVFVEGPADWSPHVPELVGKANGHSTYRIKFSRLGAKTPIEGAVFRVTMVADDLAVEDSVPLD